MNTVVYGGPSTLECCLCVAVSSQCSWCIRAVAIGAAGAAIAAPILRIPELILDGLPLYNSAASNLFRARGGVAPFMQSIEYNIESVFRGF